MIYSIEKRKISDGGTVETVYEIYRYEGIRPNGSLYGGELCTTKKRKEEAEACLRRKGMRFLIKRNSAQDVWIKEE